VCFGCARIFDCIFCELLLVGGWFHGASLEIQDALRIPKFEAFQKEWSQAELAAQVGVARGTINAIETGKYDPSLPLAFKIARSFGKKVEEDFCIPRSKTRKHPRKSEFCLAKSKTMHRSSQSQTFFSALRSKSIPVSSLFDESRSMGSC
jgi:putative transcriptional regulator